MSLILDALRKMEQERRSRRLPGTDIRPEVLSYRGMPRKPKRAPMALAAAAIIIALVAASAGWYLLRTGETPVAPPRQTPQNTAADPSSPPAAPQPQAEIAPAPIQIQPAPAAPRQQQPATAPRIPEPAAPPNDGVATSAITVSGIAFQDERNMRRAVINGALVGEGAEVAGARVLEIRENRVRFGRNGETFEVIQSSAFAPH
ncbi:hypothetical protein OR1_00263 [Geobacter sp. OR-1]|uniref:hypothetical protein n=1 Tax=Geobacter sp. OR-1 TaxID=1266765 RepID=UPI00054227A1|nr:hypothetical protein [Geobacter sp. OR-1]GAM07993.1 hypothetical protein OR1_00263 [Geobacter sp. OR-1]